MNRIVQAALKRIPSPQLDEIERQLAQQGYALNDVHTVTIKGHPDKERYFALVDHGLSQYQAYAEGG